MKRKPARQPPPAEQPLAARAEYTGRELVLLAIVLAAGVAARVWAVSHAAVEHFDEGVYASNIYFGAPDYAYPQQRFFAPPLLPALIEAGIIVGLPPNLAALLPGFLAGCGTIVALWWFGRSWFGPEVGLAAAALVALSDFHITFSATALTDVLLGLWLVLAVDAIGRSLAAGDYRWAIGAGIYTGLAWWTKYNGWLPLAIEATALPVLWVLLRPPAKQLQSWLACFAVTALVAAAAWSPYYFSLQSHGGYGPIAENHAKYVVGFGGWLTSAIRQISYQYAFGQWLTASGVLLAFALPVLVERRTWFDRLLRQFYYLVVAIAGLWLLNVLVVAAYAATGLARAIVALRCAPGGDLERQRLAVGFCLVTAWFGGMLVATPLYTPYARLSLPLLLATWLAAALNVCDYLQQAEKRFFQSRAAPHYAAAFLTAVVFALLTLAYLRPRIEVPSERRGIQRIAQRVRSGDASDAQRVIYVYAEPALYFQLRAAGEQIVSAVQEVPTTAATIDIRPIPTFLIAGPHAQRDPEFVRQFAAAKERWELVKEFDYQPSAVVWLDLNDPRRSPRETADRDRVRLYRLRP